MLKLEISNINLSLKFFHKLNYIEPLSLKIFLTEVSLLQHLFAMNNVQHLKKKNKNNAV